MAQSTSFVGQGSNIEVTIVRVLTHSRDMEIWCSWDLVEMSDVSQRLVTSIVALKNDPESQQTQISSDGGRVLSLRRTRLTPEFVEICIC
ncbi:hypothetical protein R6Q59_001735 [Mikania micrantha]